MQRFKAAKRNDDSGHILNWPGVGGGGLRSQDYGLWAPVMAETNGAADVQYVEFRGWKYKYVVIELKQNY